MLDVLIVLLVDISCIRGQSLGPVAPFWFIHQYMLGPQLIWGSYLNGYHQDASLNAERLLHSIC